MEKNKVGKIIEIPDKYSVIINLGINDNVKINDEFLIYEDGYEVIDPDSGEVLGIVNFEKEKVKVVQIYKSYSVCKKEVVTKSNFQSIGSLLSSSESFSYVEMNVSPIDLKNYKIKNPKISINDPVKKLN